MNIRIKRWLWRLGVLAVLVATAVPLGARQWQSLVGGVSGSHAAASDMRAAPCLPGHAVALLDSPHVSAEQAKSVQYDSTPPTSG